MAPENATNRLVFPLNPKRTKKGHIHRGEKVVIPVSSAKIVNAIYEGGELIGYRVSIDGWWCTLPVDKVETFVRQD